MASILLQRRRLLAAAALATAWPARAAPNDIDRFSALQLPAPAVRQPAKSVLLAATVAGQRVVAVGERGVVALSDDGARTWRQARSVPVSVTLTAVRFMDERRGWALGHGGAILATQDGGEQWLLQSDGRRLAAKAKQAAQAHADSPALVKEANTLMADGPDKPLLDLHVSSHGGLFVVGAYNLAFESRDAGATWTAALDRMDNPKAQHLYALAVRGDTWLIAGEQGLLMRSLDGGRSFRKLASPYGGSWFALTAPGANEWIVAGLRGHAFRSMDDGNSWMLIEGTPPPSFVSAVALSNGGALLANQAGQLFITRAGSPLTALPVPNLPPLTQALALPGGDPAGLEHGRRTAPSWKTVMSVTSGLAAPIVRDLNDFDRASGTVIERALFNHRSLIVFLCALITAVLGWQGRQAPAFGQLREDDTDQAPIHRQLPDPSRPVARSWQRGAHRSRQPRGQHLRCEVP